MASLLFGSQNFSTTLNVAGGIDDNQTTGIVLTSVSGLNTGGGILCFDWAETLDTDTAEYIEYGGISGNTLTGVTRGAEGLSAKAHSNGATVVAVISEDHVNRIVDKLEGTDTSGVTLAAASFTTNDPTLATGLNIQVNSADPTRGIYIPAQGMFAATTSGAASAQLESSTNKVNTKVFDFDKDADEYVHFAIPSPLYWDGSTVTAQFYWTTAGSTGNVIWGCQAVAFADSDALDTAYGTAQTVTDGFLTASDVHISSATSAITVAGSPVAGEWVQFRIYRDADNGSDTLDADARLMGVRIAFGMAKYNDA